MRGVRSLLVLLVIAAAVGWFTYREYQKPADADTPKKDKVFAVDAEKIDEIIITSDAGERTRLQKAGDKGWQIVEPVAVAPDPAEVAGLTTNLSTLEIERVVDENAPDLKEYGLAEPRIQLAFGAGAEKHTLLVGAKTPPGTDLYAKRGGDNKVFLLPGHLEATFNKSTFDMRDKTVLKVDREKVDVLEVTADGRTTKFTRPEAEWQIAEPAVGRADFGAIDGLVSRLTGLQMRSVVDEAALKGDTKKLGLERPVATVKLGSGSSQATLAVGGPAEEGTVYAKDLSRPAIFTIESTLVEDLKKDPSEYRQKDLFDARTFNATHLTIVHGGQTHTFEKTKSKNKDGQDEDRWRQTAPQARELDQPAFDTLLSALTGLRAEGFVDASTAAKPLAAPELTATVKFADGKKEERVTFARSGNEILAARAGEPGAARLEAPAFEAAVKALQELK